MVASTGPFTSFTAETAPEASKALIEASTAKYGFLPNLHAVLAGAPVAYKAYVDTFALFGESSFSPLEQQVVYMTANVDNRCHYCVPAHSMIMAAQKLPAEVIEALRENQPLPEKLEALRTYTRALLDQRGHLQPEQLQAFLDAGYSSQQALEVLVGLAAKTLSNFTNALAQTDLDPAFADRAWTHPDDR